MFSKFLSIFSLLDRLFSWLHDLKIRKEIETAQQLDLAKGKILKARVEMEDTKRTDEQVVKRLEKTGGYRDDDNI